MFEPATITADVLIRRLQEIHGDDAWATFRELADGTGGAKARTIDLFAMHLWPSKGYQSIAYETKISRQDFRRELDDPTKRAPWERLASETWFVAPVGVIPAAEVPEGWGLMEWTGEGWRRPRRALQRRIEAWPVSFAASLARRTTDPKPAEPIVAWDFLGRRVTSADLMRLASRLPPRRVAPVDVRWERERSGEDYGRTAETNRQRHQRALGDLALAVNHLIGKRWGTPTAAELEEWWARAQASSPAVMERVKEAQRLLTDALALAEGRST
jgi:hypothetical protein